MTALRRLRSLLAMPLACWLAVQLVMAGMVAQPRAATPPELQALQRDLGIRDIVLCGAGLIKAAPDGERREVGCWWCVALGLAVAPDAPGSAPMAGEVTAVSAVSASGPAVAVASAGAYRSRAPPA